MKRFFIIASMAILAIGCQKTEIQNEVQNQIGFSTETGKQTRAIVDGTMYDVNQPFGVYAYGHQGSAAATTVMNNVEVSYTAATTGETPTPEKWAVATDANTTTKYYWPNDPRTTMNFYAYSPAHQTTGVNSSKAPHQELTGEISHDEDNGLSLTDYIHSNMYVDFMVATPVLGATYADQDGTEGTETGLSSVPLSFGHKMTQVNFTVKIADNTAFPDVDFTINSIVLNNIKSQGTYTYSYTPATEEEPAEVDELWDFDESPVTSSYQIYPATTNAAASATDYSAGAPALVNVNRTDTEAKEVTVRLRTDSDTRNTITENEATRNLTAAENPGRSFSTTPVTMIPQNEWTATTGDSNQDGIDDAAQSFTISYTISGTGVATETVVKTFNFAEALATTTVPTWDINQKVTYTLTISLNEITFAPTVSSWSEETGDYYNPENIAPEEEEEGI